MSIWVFVALASGLIVGVVIGLLFGRLGASAKQAEFERARADLADATRDRLADAQAAAAAAIAQRDAANAQRDAALQRITDSKQDRDLLVDQFRSLSAATLAEQTRQSEATATERLRQTEALMKPVSDNLTALHQRLIEVEKERVSISSELRQQVNTVVATSENLRSETSKLSTALRKPQVRGSWGEAQLHRVVEMAGMVEHVDFDEQQSTTLGGETTIRPDMTVWFGQGKFCYVDSKAPLEAFLDAQDAASDDDRSVNLQRFAANVRTHIDLLSGKKYWKVEGSPEFVVLFIPSEALYSAALTQAPDLMEYAADRKIILSSPTSLIGLLRVVAYSWQQAQLADAAKEIGQLGRELYDRLSRLGAMLDKLGRSLGSSVKSYNEMVASMETRVLVTARKMGALQPSSTTLETLQGVDEAVRPISATELVDDATELPALLPRIQAV